MEKPIWRKLPALVEDLLINSQTYTFFQALKILENYLQIDGQQENWWRRVFLVPAARLAFPSADIQRCYLDSQQRFVLELNFMGLYGVDSVLPNYFLQQAALENTHSECLRQFLNIFNASFYRLFYLAWKKSQLQAQLSPLQQSYTAWLNSLVMGAKTKQSSLSVAPVKFFAQRVRNHAQLFNLLQAQLPGLQIQIKYACAYWQPIAEWWCLGKTQANLSDNLVLGNRVLDATSQLEIYIGPITPANALLLYPKRLNGQLLTALITNFLPLGLTFKLVFLVTPQAAIPLGNQEIYLGLNSSISTNCASTQYLVTVNHD